MNKTARDLITDQDIADLHWMARRYCDGRESYVTGMFNHITRKLLAAKIPIKKGGDGTLWARDRGGRPYDGLTDEEATEGKSVSKWDEWPNEEVRAERLKLVELLYQLEVILTFGEISHEDIEGAINHVRADLGVSALEEVQALYEEMSDECD